MELQDTTEFMYNKHYKARFVAEYSQVLIRLNKLKQMLQQWDDGTLDFTPSCPRSLYNIQVNAMEQYITVLEARAAIENIELRREKDEPCGN